MTYFFDAKINADSFIHFSEFCNTCDTPFTMYFSSEGGWEDMIPVFLDLFDREGDRISLKGFSALYSAGFEIFFRANVAEKTILPHALGMYHGAKSSLTYHESGYLSDISEVKKMNNIKNCSKKATELLIKKLPLNDDQRSTILGGGDVYFDYNEMCKLLKGYDKKPI